MNNNSTEVSSNESSDGDDRLPAAVLPPRRKSVEPVTRLEVREFGGSVLRLDEKEMVPSPEKTPQQEQPFLPRPPRKALASRGEGGDWGVAHRHRLPWLTGGGVALCAAAVVCGIVILPKINAPSEDSTRPLMVVETEVEIKGMDLLNALVARRSEALEIFRSFVLASQVEDVIPLVLGGSSLTETLRKHWQPREIPLDWKPHSHSSWTIVESTSLPYVLLQGDLPDHHPFAAYFTREGQRLVLDWKATAAFGTASFDELETGGGDPAEIRGVISTTDYYSTIWPETEYQSYRLVSPDGKKFVWGYARRGGEPDATLSPLLKPGVIIREPNTPKKITLRLERGPTGAAPNQWLISEVLQLDWFTAVSPLIALEK